MDNRRPDEFEAACLERCRQRRRPRCAGIYAVAVARQWHAVHERPAHAENDPPRSAISSKARALPIVASIFARERTIDASPISHVGRAEARNPLRLETGKSAAKGIAFFQDRQPRQPRLKAL